MDIPDFHINFIPLSDNNPFVSTGNAPSLQIINIIVVVVYL